MKFPVNFVPIEQELEAVTPYLKGRVLNAGCGDRDITELLTNKNADSVDNCDIQTLIPGAFLCDLRDIPKPNSSYDSILCNAVLEHVPDPESVMRELRRLLVPGGYLVVSVPFLQPFHPTPFDFRRYTRSGLEQLAQNHNFQIVTILPVHSLAQTLGWITWAHLEEHNSKLGQLLLWIPIFILSRLFKQPPTADVNTVNGFQAVMVAMGK